MSVSRRGEDALAGLAERLHRAYGPQGWWPAEEPFEMMAGAVLVQHARWEAAERGLAALAEAELLDPMRLAHHDRERLAARIRPAGQSGVKARRLQALARWLWEKGGVEALRERGTEGLRTELLAVYGIGPETADAILVYVFGRPRLIASAYARRLVRRLELPLPTDSYEALAEAGQPVVEAGRLDAGEFHAQVVAHGRSRCHARKPVCPGCPLRRVCRFTRIPT